ncbi:alanine--tRNA ligase [Candidatus Nomurabacteria bacterium]|nr:alanine--tRNA ligase [Candidatus Nomurabacteria bacterium]MCB9820686.1 alanine--tRNA ligase [Candidatus Nomurabacteria bacterium]
MFISMQIDEIRKRFLDFFEKRGHAVIPSAPLVPINDPSVLFNTAGMQPLVPFLLGEPHPLGKRLASSQKCVRTGDIEEVGNNKNLTFFEMLGNWSLGDYFKEEAIMWSYEFLTSKEEGLGLDPSRLYITVFEGDEDAPRDMEAVEIWKKYISEDRIYFLPKKNNWWSPGDNGPCGPDTEMFYDVTEEGLGDMTHDEYVKADDEGKVVEIWNDVFMEYEKKDGKVIGKLKAKNVDTGSGLERVAMLMQGKNNVYETDAFSGIISKINELKSKSDKKAERIVADHIRTSVFLLGDGVLPSNTERGYILRRLLRRAVRFADNLGIPSSSLYILAKEVQTKYQNAYKEVQNENILEEIKKEEAKFRETLEKGMKEFEKGTDAFTLFTTYGFPIELTQEMAKEKGVDIDMKDFESKLKEHQDLSRSASAGMFKGGLANHNEKTIRLHTAHHLLLAALQQVLGSEVKQKGSNITEERLRMDFSFDRKLTDEEKQQVEDIVNEAIEKDYSVVRREMPKEEAEKIGAEMEFGAKYPDTVSVYFIEDKDGNVVSKEFCGGPHVTHTGEIGKFKIKKEEASSSGVRRIKAVID